MHDIPFVLQCKTCTSRFVSCCDAGQGGSRVRKRRRTVRDSQRETKKNRKDTERERERERGHPHRTGISAQTDRQIRRSSIQGVEMKHKTQDRVRFVLPNDTAVQERKGKERQPRTWESSRRMHTSIHIPLMPFLCTQLVPPNANPGTDP